MAQLKKLEVSICSGAIESVHCSSITVLFGSPTVHSRPNADYGATFRQLRESFLTLLPSVQKLYTDRTRNLADNIIEDLTQPAHSHFDLWQTLQIPVHKKH